MAMKMYVWEGVLRDHTAGMAVALAENIREARNSVCAKLGPGAWAQNEIRNTDPTIIDTRRKTAVAFTVHGGG